MLTFTDASGSLVLQMFSAAHWGQVTPFALTKGEEFRDQLAPLPARYGSPEYEAQARELIGLSANLTDRQKMIAEFWTEAPAAQMACKKIQDKNRCPAHRAGRARPVQSFSAIWKGTRLARGCPNRHLASSHRFGALLRRLPRTTNREWRRTTSKSRLLHARNGILFAAVCRLGWFLHPTGLPGNFLWD